MKILYTHTGHPVLQHLAEGLEARHEVARLDLRNAAGIDWQTHLAGVEAIVHGGYFDLAEENGLALAEATRQTYALAHAMGVLGVPRITTLSRLEVYDAYPPKYFIDETWRPRPRPFTGELGPFLVEAVLREFAREGRLLGFALRLRLDEGEALRDTLAETVLRTLKHPFAPTRYRWHVLNLSPSERFITRELEQILEVTPTKTV
ncbi:MAG: hypothetical protein ACFB21_08340 [Opitutales bacterium]